MSTEQAVGEFMRSFIARRAGILQAWDTKGEPFRAKYFTASYFACYQEECDRYPASLNMENEVIQSIRTFQRSAEVFTTQPGDMGSDMVMRRYYFLQATEGGWQIERSGRECGRCNGTGQQYGSICHDCNGTGWRYLGAPAG